ncbi:MAG: HTH domain-containing protein [Methylophilaceae bacterium]|uniref:HTH domain-containing protein n=1 Tax=Methylicorpusculum sp. TaxID=2713644 RepID=UPI0027312B53|nr:HTH domain-containing protein [Methylicorpusculum sp.]MDP2179986.1 HTH domain-containing protein [Methylicorpusculum sp.]MDP3527840.1 HTH domain-containing protein [Methylicorpusculum sp.]MDZ4097524.1 HTH domain-containing protein [Methylophilaceae bacterium]
MFSHHAQHRRLLHFHNIGQACAGVCAASIAACDSALAIDSYVTLNHAAELVFARLPVVKQPAGFVFRNPGMMRVPVAQALHGGASDCRNRTLHQLFLLINLGERAGSGLPKIRAGWVAEGQVMRLPDTVEPFDQTVLEMDWAVVASANSTDASGISSPISSPKTEDKILQLLRENRHYSVQQLGDALGISKRAVLKQIEKLKQEERLARIGPPKGGYWQVLE